MSDDLTGMYQEVILEHNRAPKNFGALIDATGSSAGQNPLCGDEVTVWLKIENDIVTEASFIGAGCAISKASASMMTQAIKGKHRSEVEALFQQFHAMVTGSAGASLGELGRLKAFSGVARFPARVKCASLAWHAMHDVLSPK